VERDAVFHPELREDLGYWVEVGRQVALRAFDLIEAILRDPFRGIGKSAKLNLSKSFSTFHLSSLQT